MKDEEMFRSSKSSPHLVHRVSEDGVSNGLTPLDAHQFNSEKALKKEERKRTISVNSVTQTANGSVVKLPRLHIPGETGELAGLSSELGSADSPDEHQPELQAIAPDKLKKVYAQIKAKKIKYKLIFATTVITTLIMAYASTLFPWFIPYYHTVAFPFLYLIRVIMYTKSHWQLYCLDFCYVANVVLLVFCWALPRYEALFGVVFGVIVGPVAIAVLVFRNSIVFHDYDRMTSAYIHLIPNLAVYLLKWYPEDTSKFWYFHPNHTFADISMYESTNSTMAAYVPNVDPSWFWIVAIPLCWYIIHTILYMVIENLCFKDPKYLTSYRWLSSNKKSAIYHILTLGGRITKQKKVKLSWLLFNLLYGMISILVARLCYEYQIAHTVYIILLYAIAIYNGASFYIDVFAKRGLGVTNE
ncbi:uncharacterized protein [Watersipora subatra]|uniref:uncharacterized protein n=1 Tax=Watersipora subatra TaxID=2589382 RepID=UPI00355AF5D2